MQFASSSSPSLNYLVSFGSHYLLVQWNILGLQKKNALNKIWVSRTVGDPLVTQKIPHLGVHKSKITVMVSAVVKNHVSRGHHTFPHKNIYFPYEYRAVQFASSSSPSLNYLVSFGSHYLLLRWKICIFECG